MRVEEHNHFFMHVFKIWRQNIDWQTFRPAFQETGRKGYGARRDLRAGDARAEAAAGLRAGHSLQSGAQGAGFRSFGAPTL